MHFLIDSKTSYNFYIQVYFCHFCFKNFMSNFCLCFEDFFIALVIQAICKSFLFTLIFCFGKYLSYKTISLYKNQLFASFGLLLFMTSSELVLYNSCLNISIVLLLMKNRKMVRNFNFKYKCYKISIY